MRGLHRVLADPVGVTGVPQTRWPRCARCRTIVRSYEVGGSSYQRGTKHPYRVDVVCRCHDNECVLRLRFTHSPTLEDVRDAVASAVVFEPSLVVV